MRQPVSIFLILLFSAFLATPSFMIFFENSTDISYVHSSIEEEKTSYERTVEESENKQIDKIYFFGFYLNGANTKPILEAQESKWNVIYFEINSPPPEIS